MLAELSDLVVDRTVEGAIGRPDADGGGDVAVEGLRGGIAAVHRRLLVIQAAAVEACERLGDVADENRIRALEAQRDDLEEQLDGQPMIARQVAAAVDATGELNRTVHELAEGIDRRTENQTTDVESVGEEASELSETVEEVASMADRASRTSAEAVERIGE